MFALPHDTDIDMFAQLKGGDSVLYHALKLYRLSPELRWSAGGYIWGVDQVIDLLGPHEESSTATTPRTPYAIINGSSPLRRTISNASDDTAVIEDMRTKVEKSGAITLAEAEVIVLSDTTLAAPITKERVPFVQGNELERLVVNILMVVYVP